MDQSSQDNLQSMQRVGYEDKPQRVTVEYEIENPDPLPPQKAPPILDSNTKEQKMSYLLGITDIMHLSNIEILERIFHGAISAGDKYIIDPKDLHGILLVIKRLHEQECKEKIKQDSSASARSASQESSAA